MKITHLIAFLIISSFTFGQDEIGRKVYFYGKVDSKIKGKVILRFNFTEPKVEKHTINLLKDKGLDIELWSSYFLPGIDYTDEEVNNLLEESNIENVFFVKLEDVEKGGYGYGTMLNSSTAYYANIELIDLVRLKFEYYDLTSSLSSKPEWIVIGEAQGDSEFSTTKSVMKKILNRAIYGLTSKGAF